jgi:4a-hydroxytetrahydrobiopterin dehydratase
MNRLADTPCEPCHGDSPAVAREDWPPLLAELPGWEIRSEAGTPVLIRRYRFADFAAALAFANAVGALAEAENHHPRLVVEWGQVEVSWWTHAIGGLHQNDFILAARTRLAAARLGARDT